VVSQAGLFSAVLTAFVVDSKQDLTPSPADETVYYLRQHSTILSQISVQLSSIAPQVSIPSTPPPPFPAFNPSASNIRVNVFWFMALAFSLLAASLAILVQNWARDYMHVFQQYSDPLKSSRLRQFLNEGRERSMQTVAEAVPGLLNISLLLFFAGLVDSLLNINTKVAISTIVPIGISSLLYIFMVFSAIIYPQSPCQNSISGIFWYLFQKSHGRRFRDLRSDGETKSVSANMAQGRMQLAMEETVARKSRDVRAIRWLIDNLTDDAEMEIFLSAIPGSFNTDWGTEVWRSVGKHHESEDQSQDELVARPQRDTTAQRPLSSWGIRSVLRPIIHLVKKPAPRHPITHTTTLSPVPDHPHSTTAHIRGENIMHKLSTQVARSVGICKNHDFFANNVDLWRTRTRTCIEATASLVCCVDAKLAWFGGISELLGDMGSFEKIQELSLAGTDELFVIHWTCLSLVAIRPILAANRHVRHCARRTMELFAEVDDTGNNDAMAGAQKINETVQKASNCLFRLYDALRNTEDLTEDVKEIFRGHESEISELEQTNIEADHFEPVDHGTFDLQNAINSNSHRIISQFPGILHDFGPDYQAPISFSRLVELSRDPRKLQFIRPRQTLKSMCSPALTIRNILEGQEDADTYKELLKNLEIFRSFSDWRGDEMQRQLWRLQDSHDGGGLGCTVELFFLSLSQRPPSKESPSALYTGTFQAITSDWGKHKYSLGTQNLLLDIAMSRREEFDRDYPAYIVDKFLLLLGNIFEGQIGPHIDRARQQFESFQWSNGPRRFSERVLRVLTRWQTEPS
jgi:hypothetical protein